MEIANDDTKVSSVTKKKGAGAVDIEAQESPVIPRSATINKKEEGLTDKSTDSRGTPRSRVSTDRLISSSTRASWDREPKGLVERIPLAMRDSRGNTMYLNILDPYLKWSFLGLRKYQYRRRVQYVLGWVPFTFPMLFQTLLSFTFAVTQIVRSNVYILGSSPRSTLCLVVYNIIVLLFLLSYFRTVFTNPGMVDPTWKYTEYLQYRMRNPDYVPELDIILFPMKDKEHLASKRRPIPDRAAYSRRFRRVILKADHICNLLFNFIGLRNYKFFLLTLLYTVILSTFSVFLEFQAFLNDDNGNKVANIVVIMISLSFLAFAGKMLWRHSQYLLYNITTIEHLRIRAKGISMSKHRRLNAYHMGKLKNVKQVLGQNYLIWLLPIRYELPGQGLVFPTKENEELFWQNNGKIPYKLFDD